jgi:hypothetical protein
MKKVPLRPANPTKQPKTATGIAKKAAKQEIIPVADQILILKARLVQMEIIMKNVKNDEELEEKKAKVYNTLEKLVDLNLAVNKYAAMINEKVVHEQNKAILDQMKAFMDLYNANDDDLPLNPNPFDQFRLDHEKYQQYLQKKAHQVHLKDCEATQGVLLKSIQEAVIKCQSTISDLEAKHEINATELKQTKAESLAVLDAANRIDEGNQAVWTMATQELDDLYKNLSELILKSEI